MIFKLKKKECLNLKQVKTKYNEEKIKALFYDI
ncbi:hypothetical protein cco4_03121 [Campylobacter coli 7--1]|nr:hypothetical protein cco100_04089 [Campylobacter coli Z163]EIA72318.1 hypothetical protein cco4_03121 [Campylobacter coli 7--1]